MSYFPCPECGLGKSRVIDSRVSYEDAGAMKRRRRLCPIGHRFTTYEMISPVQSYQKLHDELMNLTDRIEKRFLTRP